MKILLLGGDGFIGTHLRHAHCQRDDTVTIVDKATLRSNPNSPDYQFYQFDLIGNMAKLQTVIDDFHPDFVYNCVAVANPSFYVKFPIQTYNIDFTLNYEIIQVLIANQLPFMHFCTSEVYGKKWDGLYKEDESDLIIGPVQKQRWIYAVSKILLDQLILAHNADACIIRPQNFVGYDMDWLPDIQDNIDNKWLPRLPACYLNNLFTHHPLKVVLPGSQQRCYTHIDDAIDALLAVLDNWQACSGQVLNVGNPHNEIAIKDVALLISAIWHEVTGITMPEFDYIDGEQFYGEGYEDSERRLFDHTKMLNLTGWQATRDLQTTFTDLVTQAIEHFHPAILQTPCLQRVSGGKGG